MDHRVKKIIVSGMLVGNNFSSIAPLYIQASTTEESSEVTLVEENETTEESSEVTLVEENETTEESSEVISVEENEIIEESSEVTLVQEDETTEESSEVTLAEENKSSKENTISTSVKQTQSNTPIAQVYTYNSQGESYNQQFQVDNSMISLSNNGGHYGQSVLTNVLDGDFQTHWEAKTGNSESFKNEIIFTFSETVTLDKIVYGARQATHKGRGFAKSFEIYASRTDSENDFELVATGTSDLVQEIVQIQFPATEFKRLKFKFIETHNHSLATACEFMFFKTDTVANEVNDIFVDSTYYELKEEYASIEKINELKNNIKNHPLESQFTEILNIAEKSLTSHLPSGVTANMQVSQISKSDNIKQYNVEYKVPTSEISNITNNGGTWKNSPITNLYDEDKTTHWETNTSNSDTFKNELTFSFNSIQEISRIIITPRHHQNGKGFPLKYEIYGTLNENTDEYRLIARGSFSQVTTDDVEITIPKTNFKKLKFRFVEADQSRPSLGEVSFYYEDKINDQIQTMFKDNLYTELSDQFNTMDEIEALEQNLLNYPLAEDYKTLITIAKDIIQNTNTLFTTEVYTLSQRGNENTQKSQRRQIFAGGNVDPTGYYVMPGETIEIYVDADENSVLPLVTFAQVGVVDESSPNNHRQSLKVGRNVITAPSTGTHGYAVYFTNRALPEEQNYAPRARIVSDKLQAYPLYIHGKTDPQAFIEQVKNHTGEDMAEVMGERFLLSSRNSEAKIAYIDNGKSPLDAVDSMEKIIAAFDKLSGYDPNDSNPVHHPTNALYHYKATNTSGLYASNEYIHYSLSSARKLFAGDTSDWGIGHEFGHQIENSDMRLIEVTNNLYSIVAQKAVYGEVLRSFSWNQGNIDNYFTFEGTKGFGGFGETYELTFGLFERLSVLQQVLNYFGDEAYANAARLVRENPSLYNSTGSHQTLITAMSAATGYDLSSHFEYFNYPVTEATKEFTSQFLPLDKKIRYTIMDTYKYIENDIETFNDETKAVITSITRDADGFILNFGTSDNNEGTIAYEIYRDGEMVGFTRTGTFKDTVDPSKDYDYQIVAFDYRVNECRSEVVRPHLPKIEGVEDITLNIRDLKTFNKMLGVSATNMIGSNLNVEVQETTIEAPQPGTEAIYTLIYSVT
ncbi:MAG: M60 family metallopeptidase, partial [Turicibacter sp.]|nr:M60 family metallopeptidase [Turicibacter sp.]